MERAGPETNTGASTEGSRIPRIWLPCVPCAVILAALSLAVWSARAYGAGQVIVELQQ